MGFSLFSIVPAGISRTNPLGYLLCFSNMTLLFSIAKIAATPECLIQSSIDFFLFFFDVFVINENFLPSYIFFSIFS